MEVNLHGHFVQSWYGIEAWGNFTELSVIKRMFLKVVQMRVADLCLCLYTFVYCCLCSSEISFFLQGNVIVLDLSQEQLSKNSVLAEILQASGILSDSGSSSSESTATLTSETAAKGMYTFVLY
jgi:hypothetical protein